MVSDITIKGKAICAALALLIGCSPKVDPFQPIEGGNSVNSNFSDHVTENFLSQQENADTNDCKPFQTTMERFIDIQFEKRQTGDWYCREVQGELLSPEFSENLIALLHPFVILEQSVALPTCVRMHFPEDFPFLLRQAVIALVMPQYNIGVDAVIEFDCGTLTSEPATVLSPNYGADSLLEHVEGIRKTYKALLKKGCIAIHIFESGAFQMIKKGSYNISSNREFLSVVNKMKEMEKSGGTFYLVWEWGDVEYFELPAYHPVEGCDVKGCD